MAEDGARRSVAWRLCAMMIARSAAIKLSPSALPSADSSAVGVT